MGLGDIVSTVLTRYKADTSDQKAAIRSLRGEQKKAAQEQLAEMDRENKGIDSQIAMYSKIAVGIGAAVGAYKVAQAAANAYLEDVRLESAAAGINIDRLRAATHGLVETDHLLAFAGKAKSGMWKLNEQQMETVLKGAMALRKTLGVELQPTIEALTEALTKGSSRALKEFGISANGPQEALRQLGLVAARAGSDVTMAGDSWIKANTAMADGVDDLKGAFGSLVVELAPVTSALGSAVGLVADLIGGLKKIGYLKFISQPLATVANAVTPGWNDNLLDKAKAMKRPGWTEMGASWRPDPRDTMAAVDAAARAQAEDAQAQTQARDDQRLAFNKWTNAVKQTFGDLGEDFVEGLVELTAEQKKRNETAKRAAETAAREYQKTIEAAAGGLNAFLQQQADAFASAGQGLAGGAQAAFKQQQGFKPVDEQIGNAATINAALAEAQTAADKLLGVAQNLNAEHEAATDRRQSMISAIFGSPEEFNGALMAAQQLGAAFDIMGQAGAAAVDAWITGQGSMGKSFAMAAAEGLRALAKQAAVHALMEAALGLASLALGPIGGVSAGAHFAAAAAFGGVAIAAGVGAKAIGSSTGQWSKPAAAPSAGSSGSAPNVLGKGGASSEGARGGDVVVLLGRDFLGLTDLEQRDLVRKAVREGQQGGGTTGNIERR